MVEVKIYSACLKCECPKYSVERLSETVMYFPEPDYVRTDNIIACEYERVCKFIEGQEPICIEAER